MPQAIHRWSQFARLSLVLREGERLKKSIQLSLGDTIPQRCIQEYLELSMNALIASDAFMSEHYPHSGAIHFGTCVNNSCSAAESGEVFERLFDEPLGFCPLCQKELKPLRMFMCSSPLCEYHGRPLRREVFKRGLCPHCAHKRTSYPCGKIPKFIDLSS